MNFLWLNSAEKIRLVGGLYLQFGFVVGLRVSVNPYVGLKPPDILNEA